MKKIIASLTLMLCTGLALNAQTPAGKTSVATKPTKESATTVKQADKKTDATAKTAGATAAPAAKAPAAPAQTSAAKLDYVKFDKVEHDYGTVKKGADGNCVFTYKNTGKEPLIITNCYGSCGCTVPKWEKEPLMPGKSFDIKVHYDTNRPGKFEKTVTINFQDHAEPVVLHIKGMVETPAPEAPFGSQPANTGAPVETGNN